MGIVNNAPFQEDAEYAALFGQPRAYVRKESLPEVSQEIISGGAVLGVFSISPTDAK